MVNSILNQSTRTNQFGQTSRVKKSEERTVKNAITDGFAEQIRDLARKDAKKGIYMDKEFSQLRRARMEKYVSPDRVGLMAKVDSLMKGLAQEQKRIEVYLERLFGNYSAKVKGNSAVQTAEIYSPEGELIASYSSFSGRWTTHQTKAEFDFITETDMIYLQAFREARAEMKAIPQNQEGQNSASMDITV